MSVANSIIRKQILNLRYAASEARTYRRDLQRALDRFADRMIREPNNTRLQAIIGDLEALLSRDLQELGRKINADLIDFGQQEFDFLEGVMELNSTVLMKAPDIGVLIRALESKELEVPVGPRSLTMAQALREFERGQTQLIRRILQDGILAGESIPDMTSRIKRLGTTRSANQIEALTRTLVNFASSQAQDAFMTANSSVFDGEEWTAVLDTRTTDLCAGRDGNIYPIGQGPKPPAHWNCRSRRLPVIKSDFQKSSQQSDRENFDHWLRGQDKSFQEEYFSQFPNADERLRLFREGLEMQDFRDETGRTYSLEQLRALHPMAFRDADIAI